VGLHDTHLNISYRPNAIIFKTRIKYYYNISIWCLNEKTFNVCQPIPLDRNTSAGKVYLAQMAAVVRIIMTRIGSDHVTCAKTFWTAFDRLILWMPVTMYTPPKSFIMISSIGLTIFNEHLPIILYIFFTCVYSLCIINMVHIIYVFKHFRNATNLSFLMYEYIIIYWPNTVLLLSKPTIVVSMSKQITFCYINEWSYSVSFQKLGVFIGNNNS